MRLVLTLIVALLCTVAAPIRAIGVMPPSVVETETADSAQEALAAYKAELATMTPAERRSLKREQKRELRQVLKQYKQDKNSGKASEFSQTALILFSIIPPLGVYLHQGEINEKFWIALLLTILLWLPGFIYAVLVVTGSISKKK